MTENDKVAEILAEWHDRARAGEYIEAEELIQAHPELSTTEGEDLRLRLGALEVIDIALDGDRDSVAIPSMIGEHRILREIGRGGMGVVYEAEQMSMRRRVALKVLSPGVMVSPRALKRFQREARAAGQLHHTNIVPVHTLGRHEGTWYYTMDLISGRPLSRILAGLGEERHQRPGRRSRRSLMGHVSTPQADPPGESDSRTAAAGTRERDSRSGAAWFRQAAEVFVGVAEALHAAHSEGIVHRDVKPANLLLGDDGILMLVDFGLAHLEGSCVSITNSGELLGTPAYMSPEQAEARGVEIDHRTDIYSLGATMYEVLTLQPPFDGENLHEICSQIVHREPLRPRQLDGRIPRDFETIVLRAMEKDRRRRYSNANELARDLRRFAEGAPIRARRIGPVGRAWRRARQHKVYTGLVLAILLLAVAGSLLGLRAAREKRQRVLLQYARLCALADTPSRPATDDFWGFPRPQADSPREILDRAIALAPDQPQAWLQRALLPGADLEERLEDTERARERGLPLGTVHAARAHLLASNQRWDEAEVEEELARRNPGETAADALFAGEMHAFRNEHEQAVRQYSLAIDGAPGGSSIALVARNGRARIFQRLTRYDEALADLQVIRGLGDPSLQLELGILGLWRKMGNRELAERRFEEVVSRARAENTAEGWVELCAACGQIRDADWFERAATEAAELHPESARLLAEAARAHGREGRTSLALRLCDRALVIEPENHDALSVRGAALFERGEHAEAALAYQDALLVESDCVDCNVQLGRIHVAQGEREAGLERFREAISLDSRSVFAWTQYAVALRATEDRAGAEGAFLRALELDDRYASAHLNYGSFLADVSGDPTRALEHFARARQLAPAMKEAPLNLGIVHERLDHLDEARRFFEQAVALAPADYTPRDRLWRVLRASGLHDQARAAIERVLEEALPEGPDADHLRGHAQFELERWEEARGSFERALRERPGWFHALVDLGRSRQRLGDGPGAIEAYEKALACGGEQAEVWNCLGNARAGTGDVEGALDAYSRAIELQPGHADALYNRAGLRRRSGDLELALEDIEEALSLYEIADFWREEGLVLLAMGEHEDAVQAFVRAAELDPHDPRLPGQQGVILHNFLGRSEEARDAFLEAVEIEPEFVPAWLNLSIVHRSLGETTEAEEALREVQAIDPSNPQAHDMLFRLLSRAGDREAVRTELERWADLHEDDPEVWTNLAWFLVDPALYPEQRDAAAALVAVRKAEALSGGRNPGIQRVLAEALFQTGDSVGAVEVAEGALELLGPGNPYRGPIEESLERYRASAPGPGQDE